MLSSSIRCKFFNFFLDIAPAFCKVASKALLERAAMAKKGLLSDRILGFYKGLRPDFELPEGVDIMHPYHQPDVWAAVSAFYRKYYADDQKRIILFGINPGRFGAGVTGVPFTDPIRLESVCGIANPFQKKPELSSVFIYEVVQAWGGARDFYARFLVSALCPLGFVSGGTNLNYYDDKRLREEATPFILECVRRQKSITGKLSTCLCLGEGTNYKYFCGLNEVHGLFSRIIPLPHPRWVMQYRRKRKEEYAGLYIERMKEAMESA